MSTNNFVRRPILNDTPPIYLSADEAQRRETWCARNLEELNKLFNEYWEEVEIVGDETAANASALDRKIAQIVANYDANCMLDVVDADFTYNLWTDDGYAVLSANPRDAWSWSLNNYDRHVHGYCQRDLFASVLSAWGDLRTAKLLNRLLTAFEKTPHTHHLFSTPRRMAALLLQAVCTKDRSESVIILSLISDETWRGIVALAVGVTLVDRALRCVLLEICLHSGSHALDEREWQLVNDRAVETNIVVSASWPYIKNQFEAEITIVKRSFFPQTVRDYIRNDDYARVQSIVDDLSDDEQNAEEHKDFIDTGLSMIRRAGKRLCKGDIFRATLGLVSQGDEATINLPAYVILEIVKRALPECIFTDSTGTDSGLLRQYEVIQIIEAVVNFRRKVLERLELEKAQRGTLRIRRPNENVDDDNE